MDPMDTDQYDGAVSVHDEEASAVDFYGTTFVVEDEDHTLANSLRFFLNKNPEVSFVGYAMPHQSEETVNIRVQTNGEETAAHTLRSACQDLQDVCVHIRSQFVESIQRYKGQATAQTAAKGSGPLRD